MNTIRFILFFFCATISCFADTYDVIVVGGGVGGTYSSWRLSEHDKKMKICLMESSNRIGGRLFSWPYQMLQIYMQSSGACAF